MEIIFKLRMLSDENDYFARDYEVPYDMSLLDLHGFICKDLRYDPENMASFFLSDDTWDRIREFTLMDMGRGGDDEYAPVPMESVTLGQILHNNYDRLIWLFDMFADRAYFLELTGAERSDGMDGYPKVAASEGEAPGQFDIAALGTAPSGSVFDEMMDEFNDFEGDDAYDDEL